MAIDPVEVSDAIPDAQQAYFRRKKVCSWDWDESWLLHWLALRTTMGQPGKWSDGRELEAIEEVYGCQRLESEKRMKQVPDGVSKEGMKVYKSYDTDFHHSDIVVVEPFRETNNTMCLAQIGRAHV